MLTNVWVTKWEGLGKDVRITDTTNGNNFLLNGNRINGLEIRATTKSKFMFNDSFHNGREKASYLEATETVATIRDEINKSWANTLVPLDFYVDNDFTQTTFLRRINVETISYVRPDPASVHRCYVIYYEGDKRMELLTNIDIKEVFAKVDTGILTTTAG